LRSPRTKEPRTQREREPRKTPKCPKERERERQHETGEPDMSNKRGAAELRFRDRGKKRKALALEEVNDDVMGDGPEGKAMPHGSIRFRHVALTREARRQVRYGKKASGKGCAVTGVP